MKKIFYFFAGMAFVSFAFASSAFAVSIFDITYPIAELGGCADQAACKAYCDELGNQAACAAFAEKAGFVSKEKAREAKVLPSSGPGGCGSQDACRTYCDDPANEDECVAFGQRYGLLNKGSDVSARAKLIQAQGGPGGCQSEKECRAYCENPANEGECLDFAEKHNLGDKKQIQSAKKVREQGGPGGCKSEKECRAYCENPENSEACIAFAESQGFMSKEDASRARQFTNKPGPGGCRGEACRVYCENPDNAQECIAFAEENGFMSKEDAQRAKKFAGKPGPGGCKGEQCRQFCDNPANQEACFQFAVENDLIPAGEIERIKKFKDIAQQGGPGGCRGEACRAYCEDPARQEECFSFAKERGLLSAEELKMAERGRELSQKVKEVGGPGGCKSDSECQTFCKNPDNVEACLAFAVQQGNFKPEEAKDMLRRFARESSQTRGPQGFGEFGGPRGPREFRDFRMGSSSDAQLEQRFQKFEQFREFEDKFRGPEMNEMQGPGGCQGPEECMKYCSDPAHRQECMGARPQGGMIDPGSMPLGGERGAGGFGQMGGQQDVFGKCVAEGGTIVKSEPPALPKCLNKDGSEATLSAGSMPRGGEEETERSGALFGEGGLAACSGPKPLRPAPAGCAGPVCKEGRWEFLCPTGERTAPPSPDGSYQPGIPLREGSQSIDGTACAKEFRPVCGTNQRTYPNACFAKADNVAVAKEGACEGSGFEKPAYPTTMPPDGMRPPEGATNTYPRPEGSPQPYPGQYPPPAGSTQYQQFAPPPVENIPPQTRKTPADYFFAAILQAFENLLPR